MYRLLIEDDEGRTTIVPLIRNQINIGREEGNTIRLTERNVSRRHARLALKDGNITIEDLQSYNGVWINGNRVKAASSVTPGDLLEIGDYHLSVQEEASEVERNARPSRPSEQDFDDEATPPLGGTPVKSPNKAHKVSTRASRLVILNTPLNGQQFALHKSDMTIGRTDDNEIYIDHASVSRHHAKIILQGDAFQLVDLGSANGVQVNGEEFGVCDLRWGDIIELGQVRIRFTSEEESSEALPVAISASTSAPRLTEPAPRQNGPLLIGLLLVLGLLGGGLWFFVLQPAKNDTNDGKNKTNITDRLPPSPRDELKTPKGQEKVLKQATSAFEQEDYVGALKLIGKLLTVRASWPQALNLKKQVLFEKLNLKRFQTADSLKVAGDLHKAYMILGEVGEKSRHYNQAQSRRKKMEPQLVLDLMDSATREMNRKNYHKALRYTDEVLHINKEHIAALAMQKSLTMLLNKNPDSPRKVKSKRRTKSKRRRRRRRRIRKRRRLRKKPKIRIKKKISKCLLLYKKKQLRPSFLCFQGQIKNRPNHSGSYAYAGMIAGELGKCRRSSGRNALYCMYAETYYKMYLKRWPKGRFSKRIKAALPRR